MQANAWLYLRGNNPHRGEEEIPAWSVAESLNGALNQRQSSLNYSINRIKPTATSMPAQIWGQWGVKQIGPSWVGVTAAAGPNLAHKASLYDLNWSLSS